MPTESDSPEQGETTDETRDRPTSRRRFLAGSAGVLAVTGAFGLGNADDLGRTVVRGVRGTSGTEDDSARSFAVRIENVSTGETLQTSAMGDGETQPVPLSPGAYAVHSESAPIFTPGEMARGDGLEQLAEDGKPMALAESLADRMGVTQSGAFATPAGADSAGPLPPGEAYEFTVEASPGDRLSFATMFVPSNDCFYAPDERGLALFDGDQPLSGDVTIAVGLWDAGTEQNQEPGVGSDQAQRQMEANTGADEGAPVRLVTAVADGYSYPPVSDVIRVTLEPQMS